MKHKAPFVLTLVLMTICFSTISAAQALKPVQLPPPQTTGGHPLMEVLKDRKSTRESTIGASCGSVGSTGTCCCRAACHCRRNTARLRQYPNRTCDET